MADTPAKYFEFDFGFGWAEGWRGHSPNTLSSTVDLDAQRKVDTLAKVHNFAQRALAKAQKLQVIN